MLVKKEDLNIMANIKIIEDLKANLLCIIGEFFSLLTRGSNVATRCYIKLYIWSNINIICISTKIRI